jgi:hypothetical protein
MGNINFKGRLKFTFINVFIFALFLVLISVVSFSIPLENDIAYASFDVPSEDFVGSLNAESVGFVAGEGVTETYYEVGLSNTESGGYRIEEICVDSENRYYGIYEDYYSEDTFDSILDALQFREIVFTSQYDEDAEDSEEEDAEPYLTVTTDSYFDVAFSGGTVNIIESKVTGEKWDGTTVEDISLDEIDSAGTYKITYLKAEYGTNTAEAYDLSLIIIFRAKVVVNESTFETLFTGDNQFDLSILERTYGEQSNLRDLINVDVTDTQEDGKFYFSGTGENYFTLSGFGTEVDSSTDTDLSNISQYMDVEWYEYMEIDGLEDPLRTLIEDETITDVDEYSISLGWNVDFEYFEDYSYTDPDTYELVDLTDVIDFLYLESGSSGDEEFYKEIDILKRKLQFSENLSDTGGFNGGVSITREIEYKALASVAENLFYGSTIDSTMWEDINGCSSDFDSYFESNNILTFGGSYFSVYSIGEYDGVNMKIDLNTSSSTIQDILDNYEATMGYYIEGVYYNFGTTVSGDNTYYQLTTKIYSDVTCFDGAFEITPNNVQYLFPEQSIYTYGDKETIDDITLNSIMYSDGTIYTENWSLYLVNGLVEDVSRDQTINKIYVGVMTCKKDNTADDEDVVYIDGESNKYVMYDGRLYAGDYYFYYDIYVLHASTSSSYEGAVSADEDNPGTFMVLDRNGGEVVQLNLQNLQQLVINKLNLSIYISGMTTTKDYDGTNELLEFTAILDDGKSIFSADTSNVTCSLDATYQSSTAGDDVTILPDFQMLYTTTGQNSIDAALSAGQDTTEVIAYKAKNSYELNTTTINGVWSDTGVINKLSLTVSIVDNINTTNVDGTDYPFYSRDYGENTYALLQVAKAGDTLPDGTVAGENYYYYYCSRTACGVIAESKLSLATMLGVSTDTCLKLTMEGFLDGEGFVWDHSGTLTDFKNSNNVDTNTIFSWYDSQKSTYISETTDSSADEDDYYRIEFNSTEKLESMFENYEIVVSGIEYAYLYIDKLDLGENFVFVQEDTNELYYEYSSNSNLDTIVTCSGANNALFNFSAHQEWSDIVDTLTASGLSISDLVEVIGYEDDFGTSGYDLTDTDVANLVLAGYYTLEFTLPASKNYKGGVFDAYLTINGKSVTSIITFAVRTYLEENPAYETDYESVVYVDSYNELELLSYYVVFNETYYEVLAYAALDDDDINYYLIEDDSFISTGTLQDAGAVKVYMYNYDKTAGTMDNTIIYYGFIDSDEFTATDIMHDVTFSVDSSNDSANTSGVVGGVIASGASRHNYIIEEGNEKLYIMKKALSIEVSETSQVGTYSGLELVPTYTLVGGDSSVGYLGITIISYTYDGVTKNKYMYDSEGQLLYEDDGSLIVDETFSISNLVEVGEYTLQLFARPQAESSTNYATNKDCTEITYTINPLLINFIGGDEDVTYSDTAYTLGEFSEYFSGNNSNWGTVSITDVNGEGIIDIIDAGKYDITILGVIFEKEDDDDTDYRKNLYLDYAESTYIYSKEYTFTLTITASANYEFLLTTDIGTSLENGFYFTYDGTSYSPTYQFNNISESVILPVEYTITNTNGDIDPDILNADTYTISFTINSITHANYVSNYASYEGDNVMEFTVRVDKAPLYVTLGFEDGYTAKKDYLDENSVIADHIFMNYSGWVNGEDATTSLNIITNSPVIDWDCDMGKYTVTIGTYTSTGIYSIKPKTGDETDILDNYYYNYDGSSIPFEIEKATPYLIVYGYYDEENDIYYDYYVYTGNELVPNVKRKYKDAFIDESVELISSSGLVVTYEGLFIGSDKLNIQEEDIDRVGDSCVDVGKYVFSVSIVASDNYAALEPEYYYLEVTKAELTMTVLGNSDGSEDNRGYSTMVYNNTCNYPTFNVLYSGFVGKDKLVSVYKNSYEIYSYNLLASSTTIQGLELANPLYKIHLNSDISDEDSTPVSAGTYYLEIYIDNVEYGVSKNYNININYFTDGETTLYPELVITKRVIDITSAGKIVKTYDGTDNVISNAVTKSHYTFTEYSGIAESGVVDGDDQYINLALDYDASCYERINVLDENLLKTTINVRIYGYSIDNANYELNVSKTYTDENGDVYFYLLGTISQATAKIDFIDEDSNVVMGKVSMVYDSYVHALTPDVEGINNIKLVQNIGFTLLYVSANYNSENAPSEAGEYTVTIAIIDTNYVASEVNVVLEIEKAEVAITFNGDASPIYGTTSMGLTAYAEGVGGYYKNLAISYYDANGKYISNIVKADAGTYTAVATHNATTNFKYMTGNTVFTIRLREVTSVSSVSSSYLYTGKFIIPVYTIEFNNVIYYPTLKYDIIITNSNNEVTYEPYNYDGDVVNDLIAPIDVGKYRVTTADIYKNFSIVTGDINEFEILPVDLTIGITDIKVNEGDEINFEYTLTGNVNSEKISCLIEQPDVEYYDYTSGELLTEIPTSAGIYKVKPTNAVSNNYVIYYSFGVLTINKGVLSYTNSDSDTEEMVVEGSFSSDINLVVKEIDKVEYTTYKTLFDAYKINYPEFEGYDLSTVFYVQFSDGSVELTDNGTMKVKILFTDVVDDSSDDITSVDSTGAISLNAASQTVYYVAHFKTDGSVECIEATKEGNYLTFETTSLEAFCVMTDVSSISSTNDSWVLYVAIAGGIIIIAGALLFIKKRG